MEQTIKQLHKSNCKGHENRSSNANSQHGNQIHGAQDRNIVMIQDFRKPFWTSLLITLPLLVLSSIILSFLGDEVALFPNIDAYLLLILSTVVFLYGNWRPAFSLMQPCSLTLFTALSMS